MNTIIKYSKFVIFAKEPPHSEEMKLQNSMITCPTPLTPIHLFKQMKIREDVRFQRLEMKVPSPPLVILASWLATKYPKPAFFNFPIHFNKLIFSKPPIPNST